MIHTATVVFTDDNTICRFAGYDGDYYIECKTFPTDEAALREFIDRGTETVLPMKYGRDFLERLSRDPNKTVTFGVLSDEPWPDAWPEVAPR